MKISHFEASQPFVQSPGLLLIGHLLLSTSGIVRKLFGFASCKKRPLHLRGSSGGSFRSYVEHARQARTSLPGYLGSPSSSLSARRVQTRSCPFVPLFPPCLKHKKGMWDGSRGPPSSHAFCSISQFHQT